MPGEIPTFVSCHELRYFYSAKCHWLKTDMKLLIQLYDKRETK